MSELTAALARSRWLRLAAVVGTAALVFAVVATVFAIRFSDETSNNSSTSSVLSRIGAAAAPSPGFVRVHRLASTIEIPSLNGKGTVTTKGAHIPLLVNFWSSSCDPCRRELPVLARAARSLKGTVGFLGVDTTDVASRARSFASARGVTYPDGSDPNESVGNRYDLAALPTTFFLSANRREIVGIYFGAMTRADLAVALEHSYGISLSA